MSLRWHVRLFGRCEVTSVTQGVVRFRSRTALSLLAYLCLNPDRCFPTWHLQEQFWPESDGDRQAQNLRRAIADLRMVLEEGMHLGSVIVTSKGQVSLNAEHVCSDVQTFLDLTKTPPLTSDPEQLVEAVALYTGPLLVALTDTWAVAARLDMEERYSQAVARLCSALVSQGRVKEALRIGRSAVQLAPLREDVHIALITAYRSASMESEALRQYEELERLLDEHLGEEPSSSARSALEAELSLTVDHERESRESAPDPPGGAMPLSSAYYVQRRADVIAQECIHRGEGVILVQGPRQVGKSSLLARSLSTARNLGRSVVLIDFQCFGESQLRDEVTLYMTLGQALVDQLNLDIEVDAVWRPWLGSNMNLDALVGKCLSLVSEPVCWALDEADMLFERPYTNDLFGLLRSWHNRRALDPSGPWSRFNLILSYATEANLFITDLNQSPFNVGVRISLHDFAPEQVQNLQQRYRQIEETNAWLDVYEITRGHPFLCQCAFTFLARGGKLDHLRMTAGDLDGPFADHFSRILSSATKNEEMASELRRIINGDPIESPTRMHQLESAGILASTPSATPVFRTPVYESLLKKHLARSSGKL